MKMINYVDVEDTESLMELEFCTQRYMRCFDSGEASQYSNTLPYKYYY